MKNFKFDCGVVLMGALLSVAQAANGDNQAGMPTARNATYQAGVAGISPGAPYYFSDSELSTPAHVFSTSTAGMDKLPMAQVAASLSNIPPPPFAGMATAVNPAGSGLTSTQAVANKISEPATELLLLLALSALAIAVRRQSPT